LPAQTLRGVEAMGDFSKFLVKAFLRKALTALGTFLLTHGVLSDSEAHGLVADCLEELTGAALLAGSGLWTVIYQRYVKEKVKTALALPAGTSPERLEKALGEN
jgi:hypothetical protein